MLKSRGGRWIALLVGLWVVGCQDRPSLTVRPETDPGSAPESVEPHRPWEADPLIRVALEEDAREIRVHALEGANLEATEDMRLPSGPIVLTLRGDRTRIVSGADTVLVADAAFALRSKGDGAAWQIGTDRFAGDLRVIRGAGGLLLVNVLPLEEYLRGVVPWEIGRPDGAARSAVEAQAIAARTYTYSHLDHWDDLGFDVYDDTRDQVYRGLTGTAEITDAAIRATAHDVLAFDGRLARTYYSSTCGGHGATLTDVWSREGAPYLQGGRDADDQGRSWCSESSQFRWMEVWSARELGESIRANLPTELGERLTDEEIGVVERLEVVARDRSGRVQRLGIHTSTGLFEVWGDRIRWVLRPAHSRFGILRSTMFQIEHRIEGERLVGVEARGGGFGHGVGLCQTGAIGRARAGQSATEILQAYYPGAKVRDVRNWTPAPGGL